MVSSTVSAWAADYGDIFDDAHAAFHDWVPACSQDQVTLVRSCTLTKSFPKGTFTVFFSRGTVCVSPATNDHPGAIAVIRVDKTVYRFQGEALCGSKANAIVTSMLKGREVAVRTTEWPNQQIEFLFDLDGFGLAHAAFRDQIARLPK